MGCRFVSRRGESTRRGWGGGREGRLTSEANEDELGREKEMATMTVPPNNFECLLGLALVEVVIGHQCHENGDFKLGWRTQRVDHFVCPGASTVPWSSNRLLECPSLK